MTYYVAKTGRRISIKKMPSGGRWPSDLYGGPYSGKLEARRIADGLRGAYKANPKKRNAGTGSKRKSKKTLKAGAKATAGLTSWFGKSAVDRYAKKSKATKAKRAAKKRNAGPRSVRKTKKLWKKTGEYISKGHASGGRTVKATKRPKKKTAARPIEIRSKNPLGGLADLPLNQTVNTTLNKIPVRIRRTNSGITITKR